MPRSKAGVGFSFGALKKPFLCLAPMEDVTDTVFRQIVLSISRPDVLFTEFVNVEGVEYAIRHAQKPCAGMPVLQRLIYKKTEKPIIAQVWGLKPENFYKVAKLIRQLKFDGIDINMGCPEKRVIKMGCCIALINNRSLASEIIQAVKDGAGKLPVSVKTRIGLNKIATEDWCGWLLEQRLDALTVHGRTAREMSSVPAHWDEIAKVVNLRNTMKLKTVIIGNGDVENILDANHYSLISGVDGVMIGRGIFDNPWCFTDYIGSKEERLQLLREHLQLWDTTWGDTKNFAIMKKFVKMYVKGWEGASELRVKIMETKRFEETLQILEQERR